MKNSSNHLIGISVTYSSYRALILAFWRIKTAFYWLNNEYTYQKIHTLTMCFARSPIFTAFAVLSTQFSRQGAATHAQTLLLFVAYNYNLLLLYNCYRTKNHKTLNLLVFMVFKTAMLITQSNQSCQ